MRPALRRFAFDLFAGLAAVLGRLHLSTLAIWACERAERMVTAPPPGR